MITVEATGSPAKLDALLELLEPYGIRELVQSGLVALGRGNRSITDRTTRAERLKPSAPTVPDARIAYATTDDHRRRRPRQCQHRCSTTPTPTCP